MTFKGWIKLQNRMFCVRSDDQDVVIEKYVNGQKVMGSLKTMTKIEFKQFLRALQLDTTDLPEEVKKLL